MIVVVPTVLLAVAVLRAGRDVVSDCAGNGTSGCVGKIVKGPTDLPEVPSPT